MPTQLIKRYLEEVARWMRNDPEYCDWTVGMEPIPHDKTWVKPKDFSASNLVKLDEEEL